MRGQWRPAPRAVLALAFAVLIAPNAGAQGAGEVTEGYARPVAPTSGVSEHAKTNNKPFPAPLEPGQVTNPFDDNIVVRIAPTQRPDIPKDVRPQTRPIAAKAPPGWKT